MVGSASTLSLIASGIYCVVLVCALLARRQAVNERQVDWHWRSWTVLAFVFGVLALFRLFDIEELLRDQLREWMRSQQSYDTRRDFQGPLAAAFVVLAAGLGSFFIYRVKHLMWGRRNLAVLAASAAAMLLLGLWFVRLISLHAIDALLYSGPIRLNWIADMGLTASVAVSALFYVWVVRASR